MINKSIARSDLFPVLIAVAESKNLREAALCLGISQPAVTFKLKELEALQPIPMFQTEGRRKVLTHFGRALYEVAKLNLSDFSRGIEALHRAYGNPADQSVRIGGRLELLEHLIPSFEFVGKIDLIGLSSSGAVEKLLAHEIDIAISHQKPNSTEITAKRLLESKAMFVAHKKLLRGRRLSLALAKDPGFLKETPCVFYNPEGHLLREWIGLRGLSVGDLRPAYVAEDWRVIGSLVGQGAGYAIIPSYVAVSPDVERIEINGRGFEPYAFYALFEKSLRRVPAFNRLLSFSKWQQDSK